MGYKATKMPALPGMEEIRTFEFALLYQISSLTLCKTADLTDIDWEECQEARFFSEDRELHVYETDDGKSAVLVEDEDGGEASKRCYLLSNKYSALGKSLMVKEYLSYDEDGQIEVALTRLQGVE